MSSPEPASRGATVAAQVNLVPKASQTFLVSISVLAGVCIMCGAGLLSTKNDAGWGFVALAGVLMIGAVWGWRSSQSDTDLHAAVPTTLSLPDGTMVSTDSRTLRSEVALSGLLKVCEAYQRKPLPLADGVIQNGVVVPNSALLAEQRSRQINQEVQAQIEDFESRINGSRGGPVAIEAPSIQMVDGNVSDGPPRANSVTQAQT